MDGSLTSRSVTVHVEDGTTKLVLWVADANFNDARVEIVLKHTDVEMGRKRFMEKVIGPMADAIWQTLHPAPLGKGPDALIKHLKRYG